MFIYDQMPKSVSAESYNAIRTSIKYASIDKPVKTIVITSAVPGEGKSTIAGNLAISLGKNGNRVLLIDCDLRKPMVHRKFRFSNEKGLTDCLINKYEVKNVIQQYNENVYIITSGQTPPNPSEIMGSQTIQNFINELSINYDYIILDTPPILAVTDTLLLAGKSDATILVTRYGKTKEKLIIRAYKELTKVKANVIGSILNVYDKKDMKEYYKYYGEGKRVKA